MHTWGPPFSLDVAATLAEADAVGMVDVEHTVDAEHTVDTVDTEKAVELETATKVSAPIAKFPAILQMHTESRNALRREEILTNTFVSSAGSQDTSKSIASPTHE